jgi:hypothetical protein
VTGLVVNLFIISHIFYSRLLIGLLSCRFRAGGIAFKSLRYPLAESFAFNFQFQFGVGAGVGFVSDCGTPGS